jgi:hypothetical protein
MAKLYNETGFSAKKPRDAVCDGILDFIRPAVEQYSGQAYSSFDCVEYMEKPSYGTNYKIKVQTDKDFMHLHVFRPRQGLPQVNFIERGRRQADDLAVPFDLRNITAGVQAGSFWDYS